MEEIPAKFPKLSEYRSSEVTRELIVGGVFLHFCLAAQELKEARRAAELEE